MFFNTNKSLKGNSPLHRSLTPTMLIESPKMTLANYKKMIKNSKEKSKTLKPGTFASTNNQPVPSLLDTIISTDTCIFPTSSIQETTDVVELKSQLQEMQRFTKNALEAQRLYFEEIIAGLEQEIKEDKDYFNKEISLIREEIIGLKEEKSELSTILPENQSSWDLKTQYFKNQEFISILERQNQLLYEKIMKSN
ncbi:hypothetical protein SteCoe_3107 [Stentor coeruleus]|uniref:Uncharacterized protein n=1 Tax=Stentor coeruleus TaxID=5963 RepID=A0A1R2CY26_9CILI|nr:hypothetical protein SteCoe_3107 [Stentor coeruleus]